MPTMNVSLPDNLRAFVEEQVAAGGYSSTSEYVRVLVRRAKSEKELEEKLLAALESEDLGEIAPDFFDRLRDHAKKLATKKPRS